MQSSLEKLFRQEYARAKRNSGSGKVLPPPAESADLDSYKTECAVVPAKTYKDMSFDAMLPTDFKLFWGNDAKVCLVFLPFDDGGNMKDAMKTQGSWENFLEEKKFARLFSIMQNTKLTTGFPNFADPPGRYFELLPPEIRADISAGGCSFHVEYKNPKDLFDAEDRKWFAGQCGRALENLRRILGTGMGAHGGANTSGSDASLN
jgi:hypothetical protein